MHRHRKLLAIALVVAFVAFLAWSTLSAQKATCNICIVYNGVRNCASASNETIDEAAQAAQTTACGPLTHGMNDAVACQRRQPVSQECHGG